MVGVSVSSPGSSHGAASRSRSVIGVQYVPNVVTNFGGTSADDRVTVALLFLLLLATIGQAVGLAVGLLVHRALPPREPMPAWDHVAGGAVGLLGVLVLVWMVIPSLATAKGWPARMARGSRRGRSDRAVGARAAGALRSVGKGDLGRAVSLGARVRSMSRRIRDSRPRRRCRRRSTRVARASIGEGERARVQPDPRGERLGRVAAAWSSRTRTSSPARTRRRSKTHRDERCPRPSWCSTRPATSRCSTCRASTRRRCRSPPDRRGDAGAVYGYPGGGALTASPAKVGQEILAVGHRHLPHGPEPTARVRVSRARSNPATPVVRSSTTPAR